MAPDTSIGGRAPTSHERMAGRPWDASYHDGPAPWDIGRPQSAIVDLLRKGAWAGPALDAGCGTGEHTLLLAAQGLDVLGIDVAETALAMARRKAAERGVTAEFLAADALQLGRLKRRFASVLDCALFHTFDADERRRYVESLRSVTGGGAMLHVLCFSDQGPDLGPHPVGEGELRSAFGPGTGWRIASLEAARIDTRFHEHGAPGWLAAITRA